MYVYNQIYTWVGNPPKRHYLCEEDSKGPHVRFDAEDAEVDGLGCRPLDGKLGACVSTK